MTRGGRVIAFVERYCRVPEGKHVGKPLVLMEFQKRFIRAIYDNPEGTSRAYLSVGRKNGKSALIACIALAHIVGPEARQNSQIISGARSREQAALVFKLMHKMVGLSPELRAKSVTRITPSQKMITGVRMNVEYKAISAEAGTAHGLSPVLAILDEVGQIKGPTDDFVEAITTSQGAHDNPLLIAISTQAATDGDLFSRWIDDAETSRDARIVSHVYRAPENCELMDREAWKASNPAMGEFRSVADIEDLATRAQRLPSEENSFRWLYLNQRIDASAPFISRTAWTDCAGPVVADFKGLPVYCGLDLSEVSDLTAFVAVAPVDGVWNVKPVFWLPGLNLADKARADRVPYDVWARDGWLQTTPGKTVDYEYVSAFLWDFCQANDVRKIAFDRWNWRHLKPWLAKAGFSEDQLEGDAALFEQMGQGFQSMSPALRDLESAILNQRIAHGGHPVLTMCAANATVQADPAGNRKLSKIKSHGRIDGMVSLAMAMSVAGTWSEGSGGSSYLEDDELMVL
jgi:phage terminase large subunit-like protein